MPTANGPHALRVAGRYTKDTPSRPPVEDQLAELLTLFERLWAEAIAEHQRAKQEKGGHRE